MRLPAAVFLFTLLLSPAITFAWPGKVINIADADTITVLTDDRQQVRIRLYGIDAPEGGQAYGKRATQYVKRLLADRPVVEVDVKDSDRYGRTVAVVILPDGRNLNEEIDSAGYA
jgi:micrococcal nuclease